MVLIHDKNPLFRRGTCNIAGTLTEKGNVLSQTTSLMDFKAYFAVEALINDHDEQKGSQLVPFSHGERSKMNIFPLTNEKLNSEATKRTD